MKLSLLILVGAVVYRVSRLLPGGRRCYARDVAGRRCTLDVRHNDEGSKHACPSTLGFDVYWWA